VDIDWLDDALPALARLRERPTRFDVIMLTAVWMHLDADERAQAMGAVDALLAGHGLVFLSLRHGRCPPAGACSTYRPPRPSHWRSHMACAAHCSQRSGLMDRTDVHWTNLVLQR
jgi:hypothetical protein